MTKCKIYFTSSAARKGQARQEQQPGEYPPMKAPMIYYLALVAFSIMTIFIGMVLQQI